MMLYFLPQEKHPSVFRDDKLKPLVHAFTRPGWSLRNFPWLPVISITIFHVFCIQATFKVSLRACLPRTGSAEPKEAASTLSLGTSDNQRTRFHMMFPVPYLRLPTTLNTPARRLHLEQSGVSRKRLFGLRSVRL